MERDLVKISISKNTLECLKNLEDDLKLPSIDEAIKRLVDYAKINSIQGIQKSLEAIRDRLTAIETAIGLTPQEHPILTPSAEYRTPRAMQPGERPDYMIDLEKMLETFRTNLNSDIEKVLKKTNPAGDFVHPRLFNKGPTGPDFGGSSGSGIGGTGIP